MKKTLLLAFLLGGMFFYGDGLAQENATATTSDTTTSSTATGVKRSTGNNGSEEKLDFEKASLEDRVKFLEMQKEDAQESLEELENNPEAIKDYENAQKLADTMTENYDAQNEKLSNLQSELKELESAKDQDVGKIEDKKQEVESQKKVVDNAKENVQKSQENLNNTAISKTKQDLGKTKEQKALWENVYNSSEFDTSLLTVDGGNENKIRLMTDDPESEYNLFNRIINIAMGVIGTFAVLMLIIGGYFFVISAGDENNLQKAKNIFIQTILGLIVAFLSVLIVQAVFSFLF